MAPATARRLRVALLLAMLLVPSAGGGAAAPIYIWRDASGAVHFSALSPAAPQPR